MTKKTSVPKGFGPAGGKLWGDVTDVYELADHELALLCQACSTLDAIARLQETLDSDEILDASPQGRRVHPALPEIRQQRIVFARLVAQLDIPVEEGEERTKQRRKTRGAYKMRVVS